VTNGDREITGEDAKRTMDVAPIKKFKCKIESPDDQSKLSFIRMPFDVRETFGKGRVPVKLTVNGYTYRTTICHMGGQLGRTLAKKPPAERQG
jgi:hypothetical protein